MKKKHVLFIGVLAITAMVSFMVVVNTNLITRSESKGTAWPKNNLGVTYGSGLDAVSPEDEPDLIKVEATNGKVGYAYRADLEGPEPSSPAAAIAQQKAKKGKPDIIPVYEVDGVTQIGVFFCEHNTGNAKLIK
ncbi:MAG: hypothetical protein QMD53_02615 [Actinomycetota bacterium]|nr:hypothetical protein [Actinomycetota bacterium]